MGSRAFGLGKHGVVASKYEDDDWKFLVYDKPTAEALTHAYILRLRQREYDKRVHPERHNTCISHPAPTL